MIFKQDVNTLIVHVFFKVASLTRKVEELEAQKVIYNYETRSGSGPNIVWMRDESKNKGGIWDDRTFNGGIRVKNISAEAAFAHYDGQDAR